MDRRSFLRTVGVIAGAASGGGLLAACGSGDSGGIPSGDPSLVLQNTSFETLTGAERTLTLTLLQQDATPIADAEMQVYVRRLREDGGEVLSGPVAAEYYDDGTGAGTGSPTGNLYRAVLPLPEPGNLEVVGVVDDEYGTATVNVVSPENAQAPVPGAMAIATATPTEAADLGFERICTEEPQCGMHEVSLDEALAAGRPVALLFATPAYCQTVSCGPAVGNLDLVRTERDWGDAAFIHCEIYPAAPGSGGTTQVAEPVADWGLPTEPWLFTIGADGMITDRLDGPMLPVDITGMLEGLA